VRGAAEFFGSEPGLPAADVERDQLGVFAGGAGDFAGRRLCARSDVFSVLCGAAGSIRSGRAGDDDQRGQHADGAAMHAQQLLFFGNSAYLGVGDVAAGVEALRCGDAGLAEGSGDGFSGGFCASVSGAGPPENNGRRVRWAAGYVGCAMGICLLAAAGAEHFAGGESDYEHRVWERGNAHAPAGCVCRSAYGGDDISFEASGRGGAASWGG